MIGKGAHLSTPADLSRLWSVLALPSAVLLALVLCAAAADTDIPPEIIRTDALTAAGFILAVIAGGSLINRRK